MKAWVWRTGLICVLSTMLAVGSHSATIGTASARPSSASAINLVPATKVTVFHPRGSKGAAQTGNCAMGGSLALNRADAWRCIVGNAIYDPCFSSAAHASSVICDASPTNPYGIKVTLARSLPTHQPVTGKQAWILQLGDGTNCVFLTGATFGMNGQRANYGCTDQQYIIGDPQTGKIWYAAKAHLASKPGPKGPTADRIYAVSIAEVWM